jgi:hypothetical protein
MGTDAAAGTTDTGGTGMSGTAGDSSRSGRRPAAHRSSGSGSNWAAAGQRG